jgi:homopolymeric O-antigen transport system permease protein
VTAAGAPTALPAAHEITIRPPGRWASLELRDLWVYRELLYFLAKRELQIRYKQSVFGISWAVLQPLAYALIFTLFFGRLAKVPSEGVPYPLFALAGLTTWLFNSQAVSQSADSLVREANLLSKVYFPRIVLPVAKVLSFLVDLLISLAVLVVFIAIYGAHPGVGLALLPLFLLLSVVTAASAGMLLGAVNVQYRDVSVTVPLLVQLWLFATPVIYPGSLIKGGLQYVYSLNPMVSVVQGTRWAFLGTPAPTPGAVAVSAGSALVIALVALVYFRRTERFFADVI